MNLIASEKASALTVAGEGEWRQLHLSIAADLLCHNRTPLPASGTLVTLPMAPSNSR
jgi:hypothetical protein